MKTISVLLVTFALAIASGTRQAHAEGCPEARSQRLAGAFADAESAARACLDRDPEDVGTWLELARALGLQQQFSPALEWTERGLERYPDDVDIALWRVRLFAWSGRLGDARALLDDVTARVPEVLGDRETAMLSADIRYWSRDWRAAETGFTTYLSNWPDDPDATLKRAIVRDELARRDARFEVSVEPSFSTGSRADLLTTRLSVTARVWEELRVGAAGEVRARDGVPAETMGFALFDWRGESVVIDAGIGAGGGALTPALSAWIEPSLRVARPLWASLRYWRLDFADAADGTSVGGHVLSPAVVVAAGPVELDVRYWLGLEDDASTTHAGLLRTRWSPSPSWTLEAGGGAGTAADYLDPYQGDSTGHWLALVGVRFSPSWRHRISAGYVQRHESSADRTELRHEVSLGWQMTL